MPAGQGEQQALLGNNRRDSHSQRRNAKKLNLIGSSKHLLLGSWINVLIVFLPLAFVGMSWMSSLVQICTSVGGS